jgi:hypothetical protein
MNFNALLKLAVLASACLLPEFAMAGGGKIRIGDTPARRIAKDRSLPGKGVEGQCLPFAVALHQKFKAAGIPSKVITYGYQSLKTPISSRQPTNGAHAVVAYNDEGRTYVMDNQSWAPTWVHDGSAVAMTQQFSGMDYHVDRAGTGSMR